METNNKFLSGQNKDGGASENGSVRGPVRTEPQNHSLQTSVTELIQVNYNPAQRLSIFTAR